MAASAESRGGLYYGWIIVPFLMMFPIILFGMYLIGIGPSTAPLQAEFGWSRTFIAGAYSTAAGISAFVAPVLGYAVDRLGARMMLLGGGIAMGLGGLVVSLDDGSGILWYVGWFIMVAVGPVWAGYPNLNKIGSTWFLKRRGLVIGMITFAGAFNYLMATVHTFLIDTYGWRANWQILGAAMFVVSVIGFLVVRERPEDKGYRIDGVRMTPEERAAWAQRRGQPVQQAAARPQAAADYSFTWLQAIRIPALWLICIAGAAASMALNVQTTQQQPYLEGMGIPRLVAAAVLGAMGLASAPWRFVVGWLMDRFGRGSGRFWYAIALAMEALGMIILIMAKSVELVWVFVVVFACGQGMSVTAPVAMMAFYFGPAAYGTVYGIRMAVVRVGTVLGPIFAAYIYDTTGSYEFAFTVTAVALVIAAAIMLLPWAAPPKIPIGAAGSGGR